LLPFETPAGSRGPASGPQTALDAALTETDVLRILARTGKPGDRLRAADIIGR